MGCDAWLQAPYALLLCSCIFLPTPRNACPGLVAFRLGDRTLLDRRCRGNGCDCHLCWVIKRRFLHSFGLSCRSGCVRARLTDEALRSATLAF